MTARREPAAASSREAAAATPLAAAPRRSGRAAVFALALNTFREAIRNKVLHSLLGFALLLIFSALAVGQLSLGEEARITRDFGLGGIGLFGVLIAIFVGVNLVYKELQLKTIYAILAKPVRRYEFILGKFAGMVLTLVLQIAIMALVLVVVCAVQGARPDAALAKAVWLLVVEVVVVTAVAVMFSSFSTPFLSGAFTLGIYVVGRLQPELRGLDARLTAAAGADGASAAGNLILRGVLTVLTTVFPDLHLFYVSGHDVAGKAVSVHGPTFVDWGYVAHATAYGLTYAAVMLFIAALIFRRRDFV
jgi:ABC-type transport system involved in multi-copper enzyme maturation permease subunit